MGRPLKDLALRRNGKSFQVWVWGNLERSVSVRELTRLLDVEEAFRTGPESAQERPVVEADEKVGFHTESDRTPDRA